jgi:hypothetical protein
MELLVLYPVYFFLKCLAYGAWSYYGLRVLHKQSSIGAGISYGFARVGLGIFFGAVIFFLGNVLHLKALGHPWLLYGLIYVPVRYLEWSIMAALMGAKGNEAYRVGDGPTQRWIVQGIGVSYLADLPMILLYAASGSLLPVGRFLC